MPWAYTLLFSTPPSFPPNSSGASTEHVAGRPNWTGALGPAACWVPPDAAQGCPVASKAQDVS